MIGVVGDTLPLGLGIALNPIAIIASILILTTAGARINSLVFTIGWVLGLTALLLLTALFVQSRAVAAPHETRTAVAVGEIVCGIALIAAAVWQVRGNSRSGEEGKSPRWMRLLDQVGVVQSLALGLFLAVVSMRNLLLVAAAASVIGQAGLGRLRVVSAIMIFVIVCTLGILIPLLVRFFGGERADDVLHAWREWLGRYATAMTAVVMILLGAYLTGRGIRTLA
jgi:hypothetical protein